MAPPRGSRSRSRSPRSHDKQQQSHSKSLPNGKGPAVDGKWDGQEDEAIARKVRASLQVLEHVWDEVGCEAIEANVEHTGVLARAGKFKPKTVDRTPLRSKFFFGYGYTYGSQISSKGGEQLLPPGMVDPIPEWIEEQLIRPLEEQGIVRPGWINSAVVNDYRPGGMIVSHIDPPKLFARPIYISSFFAEGRLVFGSRFSFPTKGGAPQTTPPKCVCPMPRGSVTVMDGFSADGITHGIRPEDLDGRRVSIVLRHVFEDAPKLGDAIAPPQKPLVLPPVVPRPVVVPKVVLPPVVVPSVRPIATNLPAACLKLLPAELQSPLPAEPVVSEADIAQLIQGAFHAMGAGAMQVKNTDSFAAQEPSVEASADGTSDNEEELDEFGRRRLRMRAKPLLQSSMHLSNGAKNSAAQATDAVEDSAGAVDSIPSAASGGGSKKRGAAALTEKQQAALERLNKRARRGSD